MFGSSYKIARVWGIPIKVHVSLIILLIFLALRFGVSEGLMAIPLLLIIECSVFISIALHELGHSYVAIRKGCRVREITLMFIGGAAQMERIPDKPSDEFQMAIAGPLVSITLGATGLMIGRFFASHGWHYMGSIASVLGTTNLILAGFNLLPSFPMDGGRVLRSLLAPKMGRLRATFIAARLGKIMAVLFGIYGFMPPTNWVMVAVAFFVYTAAGNEYRMVQMQEAAKRREFPGWQPFDHDEWDSGSDDDKVIISPPPYKKGPDTKARIQSANKRTLFG